MYIKYNCYVLQYFKGKQLRNKMSNKYIYTKIRSIRVNLTQLIKLTNIKISINSY